MLLARNVMMPTSQLRGAPRYEKDPLLSFSGNQLEKVRSAQALAKGEDSL